jgi:hypothetical protein
MRNTSAIDSFIKKNAIVSVLVDHDTKFPTLCSEHFSSVVLRDDLKWVDLRCPYCGTNKITGHNKHFQGMKGFLYHMNRSHEFNPPDPTASWKWLLDQCTQWSNHPEVDVEKLEMGVHVIPVVPSTNSDTLVVKLNVSSYFEK